MLEMTTVITNDGKFVKLKNPRLMTATQVAIFESMDGHPASQAIFMFGCCVVDVEDLRMLEDLPIEQISGLLEQMVIDFSAGEE